jgi:hypothetical protein
MKAEIHFFIYFDVTRDEIYKIHSRIHLSDHRRNEDILVENKEKS